MTFAAGDWRDTFRVGTADGELKVGSGQPSGKAPVFDHIVARHLKGFPYAGVVFDAVSLEKLGDAGVGRTERRFAVGD